MIAIAFIAILLVLPLAKPFLIASGTSTDVLFEQKVSYVSSITTASTTFVGLPMYSTSVTTYIYYPIVTVNILIPFTGNNVSGRRSRVVVLFDSVPIYDGTMYGSGNWDLHPLTMIGTTSNVSPGVHTIKTIAAVDGGTLYIPHYNSLNIEATLAPRITGSFVITGSK